MKSYQMVILQDCLRPGGTERHSLWLTHTLQDERCQTRLLLFQPPKDPATSPALMPETAGRLREGAIQSLQQWRTPFSWYGPRLIRKLRELKADVVLCMGRNANSRGAWIRQRLPAVRVISTHRTNRALPLLYRRGIQRSHHCVANSQWGAGQILERGLKTAGEVTVIPNALLRPELFELDRSPPKVAAAREALGLAPDRPVLCNVSSFVQGKNQEALLRVLGRCDQATGAVLLLAGTGKGRAACERLAARLGLTDRVRFIGHTENISPLLQASDLFVSTSLRDALPNAVVEAQAAGLPVVAFDSGATAEALLPDQSGVMIPAGDEERFADAVVELLAAPGRRRIFGDTARAQARERFHPEAIAARYRTLLHQLLDAPKLTPRENPAARSNPGR